MNGLDLRVAARALGGEISQGRLIAPGPGHSPRDRSLVVWLRPEPDWFGVHSHAGDDWRVCLDHVFAKLGIVPGRRYRPAGESRSTIRAPHSSIAEDARRIARARQLWAEAQDAHGTIVEIFFASRGLTLPSGAAVLRFHPRCYWREDDRLVRVPAMVTAMRSIADDRLLCVHRTRLTDRGEKVDRRMLGVAAGAAIKLDVDEMVTNGLTIGEGIETCLAARQVGFRPVWALASAGAVAAFPLLGGIEVLTLLAENDAASDRAIAEVGARWHAAGREVVVIDPTTGDLNDAVRAA